MANTVYASPVEDKHARRRRPATACTTCRERRVRCGREKPVCVACRRGARSCVYDPIAPPTIDFVPEPQFSSSITTLSSDTWSDVIDRQAKLVQNLHSSGKETFAVAGTTNIWTPNTQTEESAVAGGGQSFTYLSSKGSPFASLGQTTVSSLIRRLPTFNDCLAILDMYIANIHLLLPICHIPSLRNILILMYTPSVGELALENVMLACAVLYAGASTTQSELHSCYVSSLLAFYDALAQQVDFFEYFTATPSLQLLQGHMLYHMIRGGQLAPFAAFGFLPQTIRCAQSLGLHINQKGSDIEAELRRRTWWHLVFLDVEASIASGLQSIIRPNGYNVARSTLSLEGSDHPEFVEACSPILVSMQGQWLLARAIHKWFEQRPNHDEILDFTLSIKTLLEQVGSGADTRSAWARSYLHLQVDRAYCMLGLRFWQLDQFRNTTCQGEVVRTACSFLESYLKLLHLSEQIGLGWFIPGFLQPLHALAILLKHLSACENQEFETVRSRELIEQVVSARRRWILKSAARPVPAWSRPNSAGPVGLHPTNLNSNPRYAFLWKLKNEVWRRFAWDKPDVISAPQASTTSSHISRSLAAPFTRPDCFNVANKPCTTSAESSTSVPNSLEPMDTSLPDVGDFDQIGWFFDIDEALGQHPPSPVEWDQWLSDFQEQSGVADGWPHNAQNPHFTTT